MGAAQKKAILIEYYFRNVKSNNKIQWYLCHVFTTLLCDWFFHIIQWYLYHIFITLLCDRFFHIIQWYLYHIFITLLCDRFFHIIQWYLYHVFITLFSHGKSVIKCDAITQKCDKKVINMWSFFVITLYVIGDSCCK
jgi:hypothetical protein